MSIETLLQDHTRAIQENTAAITALALVVSKIAFPSIPTAMPEAKTGVGTAVNEEVKQPAAKKEKPAPATTPEPTPAPIEEENVPVLNYEADVKPKLVKVAQLSGGREKLSNLLTYFKVKTGTELKPHQFAAVIQHAEGLLSESESLI